MDASARDDQQLFGNPRGRDDARTAARFSARRGSNFFVVDRTVSARSDRSDGIDLAGVRAARAVILDGAIGNLLYQNATESEPDCGRRDEIEGSREAPRCGPPGACSKLRAPNSLALSLHLATANSRPFLQKKTYVADDSPTFRVGPAFEHEDTQFQPRSSNSSQER